MSGQNISPHFHHFPSAPDCGFARFCLEFVFRIISAPSKWIYLTDPVNLADIVCVLGLPLRASIGFVFPQNEPMTTYEEMVAMCLVFFLPLFRFLKLLRYFEITRLLIDACAKSAEAVPVLSYMMALIVLISATFIYLFEDRSNIPSMPHSLWLAVVTMTTVGYGDYYPTSIGGYLTVAALTFVSVVFLALPVGIIGHEFNKSWQSRGHMLLMTRVPSQHMVIWVPCFRFMFDSPRGCYVQLVDIIQLRNSGDSQLGTLDPEKALDSAWQTNTHLAMND